MLGHSLIKFFSKLNKYKIVVTVRSNSPLTNKKPFESVKLISGVNAEDTTKIKEVILHNSPSIVINCIGLIKQLPNGKAPIDNIRVNALFPHILAKYCSEFGARLIHISTDCVFSGDKGYYSEIDKADALDFYGRSKFLGEVTYGNSLTLRTSLIGHELKNKTSLLEWFLNQNKSVKGYVKAIFSGFPTFELANILDRIIFPNEEIKGLYHISTKSISKFDLLSLIAKEYNHGIKIFPSEDVIVDRSLNSSSFNKLTNYTPPDWPILISNMKKFG